MLVGALLVRPPCLNHGISLEEARQVNDASLREPARKVGN